MLTITLTGQMRFTLKRRWLRPALLVLQVEQRTTGMQFDYHDSGTEHVDYLTWRDANVSDLFLFSGNLTNPKFWKQS